MALWGVFLCEESFARIEKSSKRFLGHEIVKNLKKMKNSDFFNDFMVKEGFEDFSMRANDSSYRKTPTESF